MLHSSQWGARDCFLGGGAAKTTGPETGFLNSDKAKLDKFHTFSLQLPAKKELVVKQPSINTKNLNHIGDPRYIRTKVQAATIKQTLWTSSTPGAQSPRNSSSLTLASGKASFATTAKPMTCLFFAFLYVTYHMGSELCMSNMGVWRCAMLRIGVSACISAFIVRFWWHWFPVWLKGQPTKNSFASFVGMTPVFCVVSWIMRCFFC